MLKRCSKCGIEKNISEYYPNKSRREGYISICKKCKYEYCQVYYQRHKDEILKQRQEYQQTHKEEIAVKAKVYYEAHKGEKREYQKVHYEANKVEAAAFRKTHKEELAIKQKAYYETHKSERAAIGRTYYETHRAEIATQGKAYRQTSAGEVRNQKCNAKRRNLGCTPLNTSFEGAEGHHIDKNFIIYIPKEIHRSIYHNLSTGQGMPEINALAYDCLIDR